MIEDEKHCGCSCHQMPGVRHVVPCCEFPPMDDEVEPESFDLWKPNLSDQLRRAGIPGLDKVKIRPPTPEEVEKLREAADKAERESPFQDFNSRRRFCNE